jgi:AraC-like DNA-binding protein
VATLREVGSTLSQSERNVRIARSAKEYIETNFHHPVHLEDLSRHTGFSIRMVQRCFRERFDTTITDFLKAVRLDAAYRELAVKYPDETNVKQVALRNGFTHLGRFSGAYRQRFGELPRETLAARPGA